MACGSEAICGFDARLGDTLVGIEAAHVRFHTDNGPDTVKELVLSYAGRDLVGPQTGFDQPAREFVAWHRCNVFRGEARR